MVGVGISIGRWRSLVEVSLRVDVRVNDEVRIADGERESKGSSELSLQAMKLLVDMAVSRECRSDANEEMQ